MRHQKLFKRENCGEVTVVTLQMKTLDADNAGSFRKAFKGVAWQAERIVIDLGSLCYLDTAGFAGILQWLADVARSADVRLCSASAPARALFELVRANQAFFVYPDKQSAMASFRREVGSLKPVREDRIAVAAMAGQGRP
jgi:anti-sigma B factor antagonist